jgi:DNA-binding NtrC family response regulator
MAQILVVDDEPDACRLLQRVLSARGHEVYAFTAADKAVDWLQQNLSDLAIIDIKLRGAEGISVLEYVRQHHPHTKAIIITGSPSVATTRKALELGIEGYLIKPLEIDELEKCIDGVLIHTSLP